ncbi:hypothetical protein [Paraclostridium sordellii]|uniref:hypothetical protein n=1 Tax=Paraclostridium sordellii TaxID=1505 RepID=UPI0005E9C413|nr:hypothetical protein [Paeniclostridium sordellii]CEN25716.1 conjugative transposon protein [[Clostridium] sordellii] [Paeniclostridium sordellii]
MRESIEIPIPTDKDGFVLLKCSLCGELFKLVPSELESEDVIHIWCPVCGLVIENCLTDDVVNLALKIGENELVDRIFDEMKAMERMFDGSSAISFKVENEQSRQIEVPIKTSIDSLEIQNYKCCKRKAKINPLVKTCGSYCPYCGGIYDGIK